MLKKLSLTTLISLVSLTSVIIGFLLGFFIKQPVTELTEKFFEAKIAQPLQFMAETRDMSYNMGEPYFSYRILTETVAEIDENPDKDNYAQFLITGYLEHQLPKLTQHCNQIYPTTKMHQECFGAIEQAEVLIEKHITHNQALKRTP